MFTQLRRLLRPACASRSVRFKLRAPTSRALQTAASTPGIGTLHASTDPFHYTTGRWLNRDKLQREARHVPFDFAALCAKAVSVCAGAKEVVRYEKKEGGSNRVFLLYLDNGARVVARVPYPIAGPPRLTTNSEVATMAYIRSSTKVPVPEVLDWSDDASHIGTEYILMEHALGARLQEKWASMNTHQHMLCVKKMTFMITEMAKLPFPAYGSLYFADAPIDPSLKINFVEGFCIGPHCGKQYWDCNVGETRFYDERPPNRGPWSDLKSYCSAQIDAGFSNIPKVDDPQAQLSYSGSVQEHLQLSNISSTVIQELAQSPIIQNVSDPMLIHPDFNMRNVFVSEEDPTCVTAIIDWQSTSIEPVFVYADSTYDFIEDVNENVKVLRKVMFKDAEPSTSDTPKPEPPAETAEDQAAIEKYEKDLSICQQTFQVVLWGYLRKLENARTMDQTLLGPIRHCNNSWRNGAPLLREELIDISKRWTELGLPGQCPYQPTDAELTKHNEQHDEHEVVMMLTLFLMRMLNADSHGWVYAEEWDEALAGNTKRFGEWKRTCLETEGGGERSIALWPFCELATSEEEKEGGVVEN